MNTDGFVNSDEIARMSELDPSSNKSNINSVNPSPNKSTISSVKDKTGEIVRQAKSSFSVLQKTQQQQQEENADEDEDPFPHGQHQFWN